MIDRNAMRAARENARLSQEDLAKLVDVSKNTIQRMETIPDYNVKLRLLEKVAITLGLKTCDLILDR